MSKTDFISARIEPSLKASAEGVLSKLGLSTSEAITLFLNQVVLRQGLPFAVKLPNAQTNKAIEELEARKGHPFQGTTEALFAELSQ
jgi:DNA-damage-inducible protein J